MDVEVERESSIKTRLNELEKTLAAKDEELGKARALISDLEVSMAEASDEKSNLNESLSQAILNYKALVIQSNPGIPEELIYGGSIEAINESLKSAGELVAKVRNGVEAEISSVKVPAGAPQRKSIELSTLSPREKIQYAIGGKK